MTEKITIKNYYEKITMKKKILAKVKD